MTYLAYEQLIRDYCTEAGIHNVEEMLRRTIVRANDTVIEIFFEEGTRAEHAVLVAYFDALPVFHKSETMEQLLKANFMLQMLDIPLVWSLNPRTDQIIATDHVPLEELTAQSLGMRIACFAHVASDWWKRIQETEQQHMSQQKDESLAKHRCWPGSQYMSQDTSKMALAKLE